jgi:hypothetical protein
MTHLNNMLFEPCVYGSSNSFRQNIQADVTNRLISMLIGRVSPKITVAAKSLSIYNLKNIKSQGSNGIGNIVPKAHNSHLDLLFTNALKEIK